jgi:hypothetical protein
MCGFGAAIFRNRLNLNGLSGKYRKTNGLRSFLVSLWRDGLLQGPKAERLAFGRAEAPAARLFVAGSVDPAFPGL